MRKASDENQLLLATLPPTQGQRRLALAIVVALLIAFGVTAPFTRTQLPRIDAFIPVFQTAILFNDLITSALLFAQFFIVRRWALLVLASGYLFTSLIVIPHALTFPGLFAPTGLLGAGLQSTVWLYIFWHTGLPLAVIVYVLLKDADSGTSMSQRSPAAVIGWSVAVVIAMVCGLTWVAIAGKEFLPRIFLDSVQVNQALSSLSGGLMTALSAVTLVLLWVRRRSVLDLWLMVVCCTWLLELTIAATLINSRFSLGWYAGRFYALIAATLVLLALLSETTVLYAHLARSIMRQRGDREARQIAVDAMAASIAHEVNQPVTAITFNCDAALDLLAKTPPNIHEARVALEAIASDGVRVSTVIASLRAMFKKGIHRRVSFDVNDLVREVLTMVEVNLRTHQVSVSTQLRDGLPQLLADRGQLQQVFMNLIMNAIEAMRPVTDRARVLRIRSDIIQEPSGVLVSIEDSGTGIESKDKDRIFEPFFTTKSSGTGIGLTICRSIIESHGGHLRASANFPHGTIFHVTLGE